MEKRKVDSLSPGDHIFIQRSIHYSHHGIYVGDDKVIHYQTPMEKGYPNPSKCRVIETDLGTFLGQDQDLFLYRYGISEDKAKLYAKGTYTSKPCDAPELVIKRAKKGITEGFSHYNIVGNNCEDFATYCKTGQRSMESAQFSAALECVAAARRAQAQGYRTPLVFAGCVLGIFTARDFKCPPKNYIPPPAPEANDLQGTEDVVRNDGNDSKQNVRENDERHDANKNSNGNISGVKNGDYLDGCPPKNDRMPLVNKSDLDQAGESKTVKFDVPVNLGMMEAGEESRAKKKGKYGKFESEGEITEKRGIAEMKGKNYRTEK